MTGMIHKNNGLPGETPANRRVRRRRNVFQIERLPSKLIDRPSPLPLPLVKERWSKWGVEKREKWCTGDGGWERGCKMVHEATKRSSVERARDKGHP